ncbi:unnamed protein product [Onchocerca flexuosa]|uniref:CMP/dCMP-type deaminase domain-containing protein n=1 Tax=Onchocerca flexuosa TaxID=387005 RepID=A0A183H8L0_9BILA|nr:unnamed protein product [Onchocerca flexuosa]
MERKIFNKLARRERERENEWVLWTTSNDVILEKASRVDVTGHGATISDEVVSLGGQSCYSLFDAKSRAVDPLNKRLRGRMCPVAHELCMNFG